VRALPAGKSGVSSYFDCNLARPSSTAVPLRLEALLSRTAFICRSLVLFQKNEERKQRKPVDIFRGLRLY
jgi:hypothetical protein